MSLCETCRAPGACCSGFGLNITFKADGWMEQAAIDMAERGLPFVPIAPIFGDGGMRLPEGHVPVRFRCTLLGSDGRCGDYENRPDLCRHYEPASDPLCAEYVRTLRGIPIVFERTT